jgi:hypothetical protein
VLGALSRRLEFYAGGNSVVLVRGLCADHQPESGKPIFCVVHFFHSRKFILQY